ncbi:DUF4142 domain-containing protein [Niabella sp. 3A5MI-3]|nr:DUF4142 domain-containing protein [Niabella beijingensis]
MKTIYISFIALLFIAACTGTPKNPVARADSINKVKQDSNAAGIISTADSTSAAFLVRIANAALKGMDQSVLAEGKATIPTIKEFSGTEQKVCEELNLAATQLAAQKNVAIPTVSNDRKPGNLAALQGSSFDKAYINASIDGYKNILDEFEAAVKMADDTDIREFADRRIPMLRQHLDSAKSIKTKYWK